jgi:hypothetical protein
MGIGGVEELGQRHEIRRWSGVRQRLDGDGRDAGPVAVADDRVYSLDDAQGLGIALGIAAGDEDAGFRVLAVSAPKEGPRGTFGLGSYGAGVDDHDFWAGVVPCKLGS